MAAWLGAYQGKGFELPELAIERSRGLTAALQTRLRSSEVFLAERETLLAELMFEELKVQTLKAWSDPKALLAATTIRRAPAPPISPVPNSIFISEGITQALGDMARTKGDCTDEHLRKSKEAWYELSELNPDVSFHDFRFPQAKAHLHNLLRLPSRRTIKPTYKRLPISDVLELDVAPSESLSPITINDRMKRLANLWDWAKEHEAYIGDNPFRSPNLRLPVKPRDRGRFDNEDLRVLFNSALFSDEKYRSGAGGRRSWWWLILLGLYTGARIGELAQLTLKDVLEVEGVLCLSINDEADKTVKTAAGVRVCPVHPVLLELGFREYVQQLTRRGLTHILPYPNAKANNVAQRCSKWFCGSYRPRYLPESWQLQNKVFHSFRHTFINRAVTELHLDLHMVQALIGHE